jgi:hypothetical protein
MSADAIRGLIVGVVVIGSLFGGSYLKRVGTIIGKAWRHRSNDAKPSE